MKRKRQEKPKPRQPLIYVIEPGKTLTITAGGSRPSYAILFAGKKQISGAEGYTWMPEVERELAELHRLLGAAKL